jgi:anti-sigma regulatory factor (Ser/Thr protein kinase)
MLTIKEVSNFQKSHSEKTTTQITTTEMSLAAGIELASWKLSNPENVVISAKNSKTWQTIELLGWPNINDFTKAQKESLVLQRLPATPADNSWTALKMEFMRTLRTNGFSKTVSSRITGAIAELTNNVWDHSERTNTGLLGFDVRNQQFTVVIADFGIGVLESLRKNPAHQAVLTPAAAIEKALIPGISRFQDPSRGAGFIDFLSVVTDLHGVARLRTGNVALTISRTQEKEVRSREYLVDLPGFQICLYARLK